MEQSRQFSVFIVDDEMYIVEVLKAIIDWEGLGLSCCGVAYDGLLAYEKIVEQEPDIVIADIRLPGLSGLELISKCVERQVASKFIIISGYGQFKYAQTAMQYGVREYILKPVKAQDITQALVHTRQTLEQAGGGPAARMMDGAMRAQHRKVLREYFVAEILEGRMPNESIEAVNGRYMLALSPGLFQILIFNLDYDLEASQSDISNVDSFMKNDLLTNLIDPVRAFCSDVVVKPLPLRIVALLNYNIANGRMISNEIALKLNYVRNTIGKFKGFRITLAKGVPVSECSGISSSLASAKWALNQRILRQSETIFEAKEGDVRPERSVSINLADTHLIQSAVKNGNLEALEECLRTILSIYFMSGHGDVRIHWGIAFQVFSVFMNSLMQQYESARGINYAEKETELRGILEHCGTEEQFKSAFVSFLAEQMRASDEFGGRLHSNTIFKIDNYIAENYMRKITLKELADVVYMNPVYLSVYFKRSKGVNVVDYINGFRVEKAKELLRNSDETIYNISEQVGFSNPKYFTKVFRSIAGVSPSDYRKG